MPLASTPRSRRSEGTAAPGPPKAGVFVSDEEGPWSRPPPPPAPRRALWAGGRWRLALWLGLLAFAGAAILAMGALFPGQISPSDRTYVWLNFALLALVSRGVLFIDRRRLGAAGRHALIWGGVLVAAALAYTLRGDLMNVATRIRAELAPAYAVVDAPHAVAVNPSDDGHFYVMGEVNGAPVRFLLDTGASDIVLAPADARRAGMDTGSLAYDRPYQTANGAGFGASVVIGRLSIGPMRFTQVPASVNQAQMDSSLLGMTFFRRLESFEVKGGRLVLHWRG